LILASVLFLAIRDIYGTSPGSTWLMIQSVHCFVLLSGFLYLAFLLLRWRIAGLPAARIAIFIYLEIVDHQWSDAVDKIRKSVLPAALLGVDCKLHDYWGLPCLTLQKILDPMALKGGR